MRKRVVRFIQDIVFAGIGRGVLRVVSLGCFQPARQEHVQTWMSFLGAVVSIGTIAGTAVWLDSTPSRAHAGRHLFETEVQFRTYITRLDLTSVPTKAAIERLRSQGFQCESFSDGNVACSRESRGTICGERQIVDLLHPGKDGAAHTVAIRFGRICH